MSPLGTRTSTSRREPFETAPELVEGGVSKHQLGFTLLEVMVALTVVAFAFVGLLGLHNRNLAMVGTDQDLSRAALLARQFITEMEVIEEFPDLGFSSGDFANAPPFRWEREVSETTLAGVHQVRMRVVWDERIPHGVELLYYIRDRREPEL
jgi:prepilin-type N-terminal cleavage/methylation domain-containing protein